MILLHVHSKKDKELVVIASAVVITWFWVCAFNVQFSVPALHSASHGLSSTGHLSSYLTSAVAESNFKNVSSTSEHLDEYSAGLWEKHNQFLFGWFWFFCLFLFIFCFLRHWHFFVTPIFCILKLFSSKFRVGGKKRENSTPVLRAIVFTGICVVSSVVTAYCICGCTCC